MVSCFQRGGLHVVFDISSIWPFFLIMPLLFLLAGWVARTNPFYRQELAPTGNRYEVLDGLRGFLALSVFLLHANAYYHFYHERQHQWGESPSVFYSQMGQIGVVLFFMITGFLF